MNRFKLNQLIGAGTYGSVVRAVNKETGEVVSTLKSCWCHHQRLQSKRLREPTPVGKSVSS